MPKPRRLGATKTPFAEEYTTRPATLISPRRGRSRPAIDRRVVVFPQPLGPSSVKSFPSGTSKLTSCAAFTISPRSFGYSVKRPSTFSMPCSGSFLDPESLSQRLSEHHQDEKRQDEQDPQRRELDVLAVLPQLPDGDRDHFGARAVEQDRALELDPALQPGHRSDLDHHLGAVGERPVRRALGAGGPVHPGAFRPGDARSVAGKEIRDQGMNRSTAC